MAVQSPDPDALYHAVRTACPCGFAWPSCPQSLHAQAVDEMAECLERTKRYAAAFSTALGLIRLDPASPMVGCPERRTTLFLRD